jgi:5-formyltetrahydrofolate cyclo-ligase
MEKWREYFINSKNELELKRQRHADRRALEERTRILSRELERKRYEELKRKRDYFDDKERNRKIAMNARTCFTCKGCGHVKEFCSISDESSRKEFDLFASDNEEFCYPMIEDEIKETRKLKNFFNTQKAHLLTMNMHSYYL